MIVLDIETSGLSKTKCGIWQIGAIDLENPKNYFLQEARIDQDDLIEEGAVKGHGKNEEYLRNPGQQSQKQLLENFFGWMENRSFKNFLCQNPQFDVGWIEVKAEKYSLHIPFHRRSFDLHTAAQIIYHQKHKKFLIKNDRSDMDLTNILSFVGMQDNRKEHNALEDCKLTAECFSRLLDGKNLFPEYSEFKIPDYLK